MDGFTALWLISTLMARGSCLATPICSPCLTLSPVFNSDMFLIATVVSPEVIAISVAVLDIGPLIGAMILAFCGVRNIVSKWAT